MFDGLDTAVLLHYIAPTEFVRWAERVRPMLTRMADRSGDRFQADDIAIALAAGRMQLWVVLDGADIVCTLVTELIQYPRLRSMRCVGLVGHRPRRWMGLLADIERAARQCFGCSRMEALVAPGDERLLVTGGWQPFHGLWDKAL